MISGNIIKHMDGYISIQDELPLDGEEVIAVNMERGVAVIAIYHEGFFFNETGVFPMLVTHWAHLPFEFKGGENV